MDGSWRFFLQLKSTHTRKPRYCNKHRKPSLYKVLQFYCTSSRISFCIRRQCLDRTYDPITYSSPRCFFKLLFRNVFYYCIPPPSETRSERYPKGVEATNFAVLASIMNLGLVFGSIFGGIIYENIEGSYSAFNIPYTGLHITIIIRTCTSLICLSVLRKIRISN